MWRHSIWASGLRSSSGAERRWRRSMTVCLSEICCDAPGCQAGIGHGPTRPGMKLEALDGAIKKLLEAHA